MPDVPRASPYASSVPCRIANNNRRPYAVRCDQLRGWRMLSADTERPDPMNDVALPVMTAGQQTEVFDVIIIGAGISGVGAAYHLTTHCPATCFVILEAQESFAGTGWTPRFPGIRSASDPHTFCHPFKPWPSPPPP